MEVYLITVLGVFPLPTFEETGVNMMLLGALKPSAL
jgi:hypothetical protein